MTRVLTALLLLLGCGGSSGNTGAAGPDYKPVASPEAQSECPQEWAAAKTAREELLGDDSLGKRTAAAQAVLAQADCERFVLVEGTFKAGTHEALLTQVSSLREEQRDTANLYSEVSNYQVPMEALKATVGKGLLSGAFARRLQALPNPTDMTEVGEQAAFRNEVATLVAYFVDEAERELRNAIAMAESVTGSSAQRKSACDELAFLERAKPTACGSANP